MLQLLLYRASINDRKNVPPLFDPCLMRLREKKIEYEEALSLPIRIYIDGRLIEGASP